MNRDALTLLGCSGSFALVLLLGNAANANVIATQSDSAAVSTFSASQSSGSGVSQANPDYDSVNFDSDTVGDMAIAKFHCDCPACRMAVMQMMQTGQL